MELFENFQEELVCMNLAAVERDEVLHEMLKMLVGLKKIEEKDIDPILIELVRRETLGTTAIGRAVALPHARMDDIPEITVALGLSSNGIKFHALDAHPVRAVFLVLGPKSDSDGYIEAMKTVSNMTRSEDFRRFLLRADSAREVAELIREMSDKMK